MINIDKMLMESMKAKDKVKTQVCKNIKAKILEFKTSKEQKVYDDVAETALLRKMHKELCEDKKIFETNNRQDLADDAQKEIDVLETLLPKAASEEDIEKVINQWITENGSISQRQMGVVIKEVKNVLPSADGATVSKLVKKYIS